MRHAHVDTVYQAMLAHPHEGPADLARRLKLGEDDVRASLDYLSELALVRSSTEETHGLRAVSPLLGMEILLSHQQADLTALQQRQETIRALATKMAFEQHDEVDSAGPQQPLHYLSGLDAIRDHLEHLNNKVQDECLSFAPGGAQTPDNIQASRELCRRHLERGVTIRTIYLDSIRRDPATLAFAHWLTDLGADVRTVPALPNRMLVYDRATAIIAADANHTAAGAVVTTVEGVIDVLRALFDHTWNTAAPIDTALEEEPDTLNRQQLEALRLMAQGRTDESIAKHLDVSLRTARRITTSILTHLGARSRFQAGVTAVHRGYLPAP